LIVGAVIKKLIERLNVIGGQNSKVQQWCGLREKIEELERKTLYPCLVNEEEPRDINAAES